MGTPINCPQLDQDHRTDALFFLLAHPMSLTADSPREQNEYAPSCFLAQHLSSDAPLFLGLELRVIRRDNVH